MRPIVQQSELKRKRASSADHASYRLFAEIISRSEADNWRDAKLEWILDHVFIADELGTCLCGKTHIREMCVLRNRENGNTAIVGNVCVNKFLNIDCEELFTSLRKISKNPEAAVTADTIQYAFDKGWINDWDRGFYLNTCSKKYLSEKQRAIRVRINDKILSKSKEGIYHA